MKKVFFVVPILAPYRISFYEKLKALNYDIRVLYQGKKKEDGRPSFKGETNFLHISMPTQIYNVGPFRVIYVHKIINYLKNNKPDCVIVPTISGIISYWLMIYYLKIHKIPVILWTCGWESGEAQGIALLFKYFLLKRFMHLADYHIAYGTTAKEYIIKFNYPKEKIDIAYNGLDTDELMKNQDVIIQKGLEFRSQNATSSKKIFLYVGGLIEEKKILELVKVFKNEKITNKAELWIIGDGPQRLQLESEIKGSPIKYFGRIIEDADVIFSCVDFFIMPGAGGLAINQAMYWGKPCIVGVADGTENDLVVEGESGFRFIPNNWESLKEKIIAAINLTESEYEGYSIKSKYIINSRSNVNSMIKVFDSVINKVTNKL